MLGRSKFKMDSCDFLERETADCCYGVAGGK